MLVWLKILGVQTVLRWQVSHCRVVTKWFVSLPVAICPLWQDEHGAVTEAWSKRAGIQALVV